MADTKLPPYLNLKSALKEFAAATKTQSQEHIKPLHRYLAMRLVIEGGFHPDEVTPHPPLVVATSGQRNLLVLDRASEDDREQTVLGGLKSKGVDVVVAKDGVGPVVAISVKGTIGAFRNLTNRMEEAIGDSANIHIMYPGLVYGFLHVLKGNDEREADFKPNDVAIKPDGSVVPSIHRYHEVLLGLTGRRFLRDEVSRYEVVGLGLVDMHAFPGDLCAGFPSESSPLRVGSFFETLFSVYDLRFPYVASSVRLLKRTVWDTESPALVALRDAGGYQNSLGYQPREGDEESNDERDSE